MFNGDIVKNYCSRCVRESNHVVKAFTKLGRSEEYNIETFYMIVECAGCNNISYRTAIIDYDSSYSGNSELIEPDLTIESYPNSLKFHKALEDRWYLPRKIQVIYEEALKTFSVGSNLLTAVAFRSIIEAVCKHKSVQGSGNLEALIKNMVKEGLITKNEAQRLHAIRYMGNDSVHDFSIPKTQALYKVLDVVEHLLRNLYIIDKQLQDEIETPFKNYNEFIDALNLQIRSLEVGNIKTLTEILDKDARRLIDNGVEFESLLKLQIESGEYKYLSKTDKLTTVNTSKNYQYYQVEDTNTELNF